MGAEGAGGEQLSEFDFQFAVDRRGGARFSEDGVYRYTLERTWDATKPGVAFIMLNPSTADESADDPTIRRCVGFARSWGFGNLEVGNLFALRSTDPSALLKHKDPVGPDNDAHLVAIAKRAKRVVCAWGAYGEHLQRGEHVRRLLFGRDLYALGFTSGGQPKHPLYIAASTEATPFQVHAGVGR